MFLHNFSHFMQIWIFPPGLILILMLAGFILGWCKLPMGKQLVAVAYILFWLLSTPLLAQCLIDGLQNRYKPIPTTTSIDPVGTALVVLGSGIENAQEYLHKDVVSDQTMGRVNYAAYLNRQTHVPIIVSGGNRDNIARSEAMLMREMLEESYGINVAAMETESHTTLEQGTLMVTLLKANNIHTIYVVTHAWHMPRSMYAFKKAFQGQDLTVLPAPMGYIGLKSDSFAINLLPSINALKTSVYAIHEYIGLGWYHVYEHIKSA
jgi:uncharacterized SAM-binding protein YcdF (DUF218 family)